MWIRGDRRCAAGPAGGIALAGALVAVAACTADVDVRGDAADGGPDARLDAEDARLDAEIDAAPELPPTVRLRAVSANICGGQCNRGRTEIVDTVGALIDDYQPQLVFLQEVCSETVDPASVSGLPLDLPGSDHAFLRAYVDVSTTPR